MIKEPRRLSAYKPAQERFLKPAIINFFAKEFPMLFGEIIRGKIANELVRIFESLNLDKSSLKPGQILWNALDKDTRANSPKKNLVPVILTIVNQEDIVEIQNGAQITHMKEKVIARITKEAYAQGGILSMRDIALLLVQGDTNISKYCRAYQDKHKEILPHVGSLHDVGTCKTHKAQIVYKVTVEKKDPLTVAKETNHSQRAVDRYLQDFYRVRTLYYDNKDSRDISILTCIANHVVKEYIQIIEKYDKKRA